MGTKNNPKNRAKNIEKKKFKGKEVEPVYYYGVRVGHGKYMAAKYANTTQLVLDSGIVFNHSVDDWHIYIDSYDNILLVATQSLRRVKFGIA